MGTDGTSVNVLEQNDMRGKVQKTLPWVFGPGVKTIVWNLPAMIHFVVLFLKILMKCF